MNSRKSDGDIESEIQRLLRRAAGDGSAFEAYAEEPSIVNIGHYIGKFVHDTANAVSDKMLHFGETVSELQKHWDREKRLEEAGWLPHQSTPLELVDASVSLEDLNVALSAYYKEHWASIRATFERNISRLGVDQEAKETFVEALDNHESCRYRSVVRLLFPEVERLARTNIFSEPIEVGASLPEIRHAVSNSDAVDFQLFGETDKIALYSKMEDHLYAQVRGKEAVSKAAADFVPNRHASLHGLVVYKSERNSINALIMIEWMYLVISVLKARVQDAGITSP